MRVLVDARLLLGGGIGRYLREVVGHWLQDGDLEEVRLLGTPRELERWLLDRPGEGKARIVSWTDPVYSFRAQLRWTRMQARWAEGCHACFFPHWDAPARAGGPARLLTLHDLTHFLEPEGFPLWKRIPGRVLLGRALALAAGVVTVSEATRRDVETWFPELGSRLRVIPNGVSHDIFHPLGDEERAGVEARWGELRPFLLFVGPLKPHKGAATALEVLRGLMEERPGLRLVQVGPPEIRDPDVARLLEDPDLAARFVQAGVLGDVQLNEAYGISECLLHPALKEGFGLPPLEAMASGTPVLVSNRSSLPEVVGAAGTLLEPGDTEAWTEATRALLTDREMREEAVRLGRDRARMFSWDRTARETLAALREVASAGSLSSTIGS